MMHPEVDLWETYGPLFSFEERVIFPQDEVELEFFMEQGRLHGGNCLEIGAGDGRISTVLEPLSRVFALEPSASLLKCWPTESLHGDVHRVRAMGQGIPLRDGSMDLVLLPYNGIHCIINRRERMTVLGEAARVLKNDGIFIAEACPKFLTREDEDACERYSFRDQRGSLRLVESVSHDRDRGLIIFSMVYTGSIVEGGRTSIKLELAALSAGEILEEMALSGLRVLSLWGDYDLSPWDGDSSPRLLIKAGRRIS